MIGIFAILCICLGALLPDLVRMFLVDLGSAKHNGSRLVRDPHQNLPRTLNSNGNNQSGLSDLLSPPQTPEGS